MNEEAGSPHSTADEFDTPARHSAGRRARLAALIALLVGGGAFAYLAFGNLGENLVYYWSPTELAEAGDTDDAIVRLGGVVVDGSIVHGSDGLTLDFAVTDGKTTVPVHARAVPPAMFREGIGVVLEGNLDPQGVFHTNRLMVKHDNEYRAPENGEEKSMQDLVRTMKLDTMDT